MALQSTHTDPTQAKLGFQGRGFDWDKYIQYRPVYTDRFYNHLYSYHASTGNNSFRTAHDVGAGPGIVAGTLARKFENVLVSEPNRDFLEVAESRLSSSSSSDGEGKFRFLAEGAESSSVDSESVDLLVISEAIHWTDIPASIKEFARQLKAGGTLCIVYYKVAQIINHEAAQKVWKGLFSDVMAELKKMDGERGKVYLRGVEAPITGLDDVAFPEEMWRSGVKRIFTNCQGDRRNVAFSPGCEERPDQVGKEDERVFVEGNEDWMNRGVGLEWLQNVFVNFVPGKKIADDAGRWEEMARVLGEQKVDVAWPSIKILATRR
ncbi:S-adenosyl-L-methionine-dependent methyltransferase [Aspergillus unguis]